MPNDTISQILGGDDTEDLRSKYYQYLDQGLNENAQPAQADPRALAIQGVLPSLIGAFLTKGKSLAFSGDPLQSVATREQARADQAQKLSIDSSLKRAGLIGDEVGRRDKLEVDEFQRAQDQAFKKEQKEEDRELRRETTASQDDLRRDIAGMSASNAAASRSEAQSFREMMFQYRKDEDERDNKRLDAAAVDREKNRTEVDTKRDFDTRTKMGQTYYDRIKASNAEVIINSARQIKKHINSNTVESERAVKTALVLAGGDKGNINWSEKRDASPASFREDVGTIANYLSGDRTGVFPKVKKEAIVWLADRLEQEGLERKNGITKELSSIFPEFEGDLQKWGSHLDPRDTSSLSLEDKKKELANRLGGK